MRAFLAALIVCVCALVSTGAQAHGRQHHHHHYRHASAGAQMLGRGLVHMLESMQPHPQGCPSRAFCGCGVSVRVFGHSVRSLWLAANWYRFPRGAVAAGNVIVRPHHVKYIESVESDGTVICYDPNSGGHQTRVHACRVDGAVVSPVGPLDAGSGLRSYHHRRTHALASK